MITETIKNDEQFQKCIKFVMSDDVEGGYVNDPKDPGGETKFGISKRAFPGEDIKNLTRERAEVLYYQHYWLPYTGGIDWPLNLCVFDCAVNQGGSKARKYLSITQQAKGDWKYFVKLREEDYTRLRDKTLWAKRFYKGWMNRLKLLEKYIKDNT